jgi:hypothetical protein
MTKTKWPKRRSPERLLRGRITRLEKLASIEGLQFADLFSKSDAWLLSQPFIGRLTLKALREMQGME